MSVLQHRGRTVPRAAALAAAALLAVSCGAAGAWYTDLKPAAELARDERAATELRRLAELADKVAGTAAAAYGLTGDQARFDVRPQAGGPLAWEVITAAPDSARLQSRALYPTKDEAEKKAAEAEKAGKAVIVRPADSIAAISDRPSPLVPAMAEWTIGDQVHWLFKELFAAAAKKAPDQAAVEGFAEFAAEQAATAFLREQFGGASPVLGAYMSEHRDERTFARLYADYRERFINLYSQSPLPADHAATRLLLHKAWAADYQFNYANRFITNGHADFAKEPVPLVELAAWRDPFPRWADWEQRLADRQGDFAALAKDVLKR